ncbi:MAG: DUF3473 domain-containing protein, partial [Bacteroidales bacterium]|nr:DUF3473 domain-containing protein [Bacteroidales bacterium]
YVGYSDYGIARPAQISLPSGIIKEFPISFHNFLGKHLIFSGGGYFRLFPYWLIKKWSMQTPYMMTYFHPRDFDSEQPVFKSQKGLRKFKSYVGLKYSFSKFDHYIKDFEFINLEQANKLVDWNNAITFPIPHIW